MDVILCNGPGIIFRRVRYCLTCDKRRRIIQRDDGWWGLTMTCCACGESWDSEGGRAPRPFAPKWREKAAWKAKQQWRLAPTRAQALEMQEQMLRDMVS